MDRPVWRSLEDVERRPSKGQCVWMYRPNGVGHPGKCDAHVWGATSCWDHRWTHWAPISDFAPPPPRSSAPMSDERLEYLCRHIKTKSHSQGHGYSEGPTSPISMANELLVEVRRLRGLEVDHG